MLFQTGDAIPFLAQFTNAKSGAAGLSVTVSVVRLNTDGTRTTVISAASATAATELDATNAKGLYGYLLAGASTGTVGDYVATFHTAGAADLADVPALEIVGVTWVQRADAATSSRSTFAGGAVASVTGNVGGNVTGSVGSVVGAVGSVTAPVTAGTVSDKTGYSLATAPPTAAQIDTQLTGTHGAGLWQQGNTVAPDNASVAAIKAKTDNLPADPASNTEVATRLATTGYTAPPSTAAIVAAILDGLLTGHSLPDSVAAALTAASSAGDPLGVPLPDDGRYPAGTAGYRVGHYLAAPPNVTLISPVAADGEAIWITIGDDYGPAPTYQQRITHTFAAGTIPDMTGGTASYAAPGLAGSPLTGTLVTVGPGIDQTVALDLAHGVSGGLAAGDYPYSLELTTAGDVRTTIRRGTIYVARPTS